MNGKIRIRKLFNPCTDMYEHHTHTHNTTQHIYSLATYINTSQCTAIKQPTNQPTIEPSSWSSIRPTVVQILCHSGVVYKYAYELKKDKQHAWCMMIVWTEKKRKQNGQQLFHFISFHFIILIESLLHIKITTTTIHVAFPILDHHSNNNNKKNLLNHHQHVSQTKQNNKKPEALQMCIHLQWYWKTGKMQLTDSFNMYKYNNNNNTNNNNKNSKNI